jgi:hypothetical protein
MHPWRALAATLLVSLLAGCASHATTGATTEPSLPPLEATATTGVLRIVVVDEAIRPIAGAAVTATQGSDSAQGRSDAAGFVGLKGLKPGTYVVSAAKPGYTTAQASTQVEAGVSDPRVVKVQLVLIPGAQPFAFQVKHQGFLECAVPHAAACFIANYYPCVVLTLASQACTNVTNDNAFFSVYSDLVGLNRVPDFSQVELVWKSTQVATDWLATRVSAWSPDQGALLDSERNKSNASKSPLTLSLNRTTNEKWEQGTAKGLYIETFAGGNDLMCRDLPPDAQDCNGLAVNQDITYYFTFFYGYTPPPGWSFAATGEVPAA